MRFWHFFVAGLIAVAILARECASAEGDDWSVAEINPILQIYVGEKTAEGTELILELKEMTFESNQRHYPCALVNRRIAVIKKYFTEDSYVRVRVDLDGVDDLKAYCGIIKAPVTIDPHNHAALWNAFVNSVHKPYTARLSELPKWHVGNPIWERRRAQGEPLRPISRADDSRTLLKSEERSDEVKRVLDPATGDKARFGAVRRLALSGYYLESAEALVRIATDPKQEAGTRGYAMMGLRNFHYAMPGDVREAMRGRLRSAFRAEKGDAANDLVRVLLCWGDGDWLADTLGDRLNGHPMELEILWVIRSRERAVRRLIEMLAQAEPVTTAQGLDSRYRIGQALLAQRDARGFDVLLEFLLLEEPPASTTGATRTPEQWLASFRQCQHALFTQLAGVVDKDFGYPAGHLWNPALLAAIPKLKAWWKAHRDRFDLEAALSQELPVVQTGKALTKRQARLWAAKLVADAFSGRRVGMPDDGVMEQFAVRPEEFRDVLQINGRWTLKVLHPVGATVSVEFDLDGRNEKVEHTIGFLGQNEVWGG